MFCLDFLLVGSGFLSFTFIIFSSKITPLFHNHNHNHISVKFIISRWKTKSPMPKSQFTSHIIFLFNVEEWVELHWYNVVFIPWGFTNHFGKFIAFCVPLEWGLANKAYRITNFENLIWSLWLIMFPNHLLLKEKFPKALWHCKG